MEDKRTSGLRGLHCFWFAAAVLAGAAAALALTEPLYRLLPNDMKRISVLLDALGDESEKPEILLFGNSVSMAGADMRQISSALPGQPTAWNFASTGQSPLESYLHFQNIPPETRLVISVFGIETIANEAPLDSQKYNAFYMLGYRPDDRTRAKMAELLGPDTATLFTKSGLQQRFESRWVIRQLLDWLARGSLRDDLQLDRSTYDLFFPSTGAERLPERLFARDLRLRFQPTTGLYRPNPGKVALLGEMAARLRSQGTELVLVLMPQHPAMCESQTPGYCPGAESFYEEFAESNDLPILNAMNVVPEPLYTDGVHPSEAGAKIFSSWLAAELKALIAAGKLSL